MLTKQDLMADTIREQARTQLDTLRHNADVATRRAEALIECECAKWENHDGPCLGPYCNCH